MKNISVSPEDFIQKTWIPEGSKEYGIFKLITQENKKLAEIIKQHVKIGPKDLVLDIGGRDGNVAFQIQKPPLVHIVDPDPNIKPLKEPGKFWRSKVQDVEFDPGIKYKLIICCHVLGYLGLQHAQEKVVRQLVDQLAVGGTLALFYNSNIGYMAELIEYSKHILPMGHFDYFEEEILEQYRGPSFDMKRLDLAFPLDYKTFDGLARGCWFLFGAMSPDIDGCAKKFLPKLQNDLLQPSFPVDQKIVFLTKRKAEFLLPTLK